MIHITLLWLLLVAGCAHYDQNPQQIQIAPTLSYDATEEIQQQYPPETIMSFLEIDDCINHQKWRQGSCSFQLFAAQWLYYHQQSIIADEIINDLIAHSDCSVIKDQAIWWSAWSAQQKTYWNKSLLELSSIGQNPDNSLYSSAYASMSYSYKKRQSSIADLSAQEAQIIDDFGSYVTLLEQLPRAEVFEKMATFPGLAHFLKQDSGLPQPITRLIVLYERQPSEDFITQLFDSFEQQDSITDLYLLSIHDDFSFITEILESADKKTFILCYEVQQPLPKEWLQSASASLAFGARSPAAQRHTDYFIAKPTEQFINQLDKAPYLLKPALIIYDSSHAELMSHPSLQSVPQRLLINKADYRHQLSNLLALPQRQDFFASYLKNCFYINQPRALPYHVLLLLDPELLRLCYPFLRYWHQERALFLVPPGSLTGIDTLDSALKGTLMNASSTDHMPRPLHQADVAKDIIALTLRWPWFEFYSGYLYEGAAGRYYRDGQELQCQWDIVIY